MTKKITGIILGTVAILILLGGALAHAARRPLDARAGPAAAGQAAPSDEVYVPAGRFLMGCASDLTPIHCDGDAKPVHAVYLDAFYIDKTEVTNAQYADCVAAGACPPPLSKSSETREAYYDNPQFATCPVLHVTWDHANAYCRWRSRRLPTEAEWEKAARGPDLQLFPWGNALPTCELANFNRCSGDTVAVGSYPEGASPYGALDMIGNVREWVNDLYESPYYEDSPYFNPMGPASTQKGEHLVRGGSWKDDNRVGANPWVRIDEANIYETEKIGFRCVRPAGGGPTPTPTATPTPTPTPTPYAVNTVDEAGGALWLASPEHLTFVEVPTHTLAVRTTVTLTYDGRANNQGELQGIGHFFRLAQSPDQAETRPMSLLLGFRAEPGVKSETLTLYRLGATGWTTQGITMTARTPQSMAVQVTAPGIYGLMGETERFYLPVITNR